MKLCDTNVISELMRPKPNSGTIDWADGEALLALSVVTVDELYFGLTWQPHVKLLSWLNRFLEERCEVLDVTPPIARAAGQLRGQLRARGMIRTQADIVDRRHGSAPRTHPGNEKRQGLRELPDHNARSLRLVSLNGPGRPIERDEIMPPEGSLTALRHPPASQPRPSGRGRPDPAIRATACAEQGFQTRRRDTDNDLSNPFGGGTPLGAPRLGRHSAWSVTSQDLLASLSGDS